jgi:hypothetical protein
VSPVPPPGPGTPSPATVRRPGAAASQLGPDAQAAVEFNKQGGLSHGKVTRCLESLFGIKLRGNRARAGAHAQAILMSVWRTCWQQGRSALDFLSQLLRGAHRQCWTCSPDTSRPAPCSLNGAFVLAFSLILCANSEVAVL